MNDLKILIGYSIEFLSIKNNRTCVAKLLSFNDSHIQVQLLKDFHTENRTWSAGITRLFDRDKITDIEKVPTPEKRIDRGPKERKPYKRKMLYPYNKA